MIKIAVVTSTRAEYGLMRPLIKCFCEDEDFELLLYVTGTHLLDSYGKTYREIENDGVTIKGMIPIMEEKRDEISVAETIGRATVEFTKAFLEDKPEYLFVDGDRYEMVAICIAAVNCKIPIIHNGGGAITSGASDEYFRHMITKMSWLHFTSTEIYRNRIIRMGENPIRVYNVGSLGLENIRNLLFISKTELERRLEFKLGEKYAVVTFHPATLENEAPEKQTKELLEACDKCEDIKFIFTKANADCSGNVVNEMVDTFVGKNSDKAICVASMGSVNYLSALKYCEFVMGNSSSGIIEAPFLGIPTINIGDRQKGRVQANSIFNCKPNSEDILRTIEYVRRSAVREHCSQVISKYGDGNCVSKKIINIIKERISSDSEKLQKTFYDGNDISTS